jgi:hypothetical protein
MTVRFIGPLRFSAEAGVSLSPTVMIIWALLDGVTAALPSQVNFGVSEDATVARSCDFIFPSVARAAMLFACSSRAPLAAAY